MIFWRKKKNASEQEDQEKQDKIIHQDGDPEIAPPIEYDSDISPDQKQSLEKTESDLIEELDPSPVPEHTDFDDNREKTELSDHSEEGGWLSRLSSGLKKSSQKFTDILTKKTLDDDALEELEDRLIQADLGPRTAAKIISEFSSSRFGKEVDDHEIREALAESMEIILSKVAKPLTLDAKIKPNMILFTGVNGVGKTTTIGKMARQYQSEGKKVMLAAADTFRAAAIDQLSVWADRNHCDIVAKDIGIDPAAVVYEAIERAKAENVDILLIDTAGRLHNKKNLMEELQKIVRVIKKQDEAAPHSSLLVLDATTGQNAISQVEVFKDLIDISGLIVTKLDGSSKGGIVVAIADQFDIPVHAIGVGEGIKDLQPFTAQSYAQSLVGMEK
jgi:fused signal recognition particle receptor